MKLETKILSHLVGDVAYHIEMRSDDQNIAIYLKDHPTWEPWQIKLYEIILKSDSVALDVGANVGINSVSMSHYAREGTVIAFEPVHETYELLCRNVARSGHTNIVTQSFAASSRNQSGYMRIDARGLGQSHRVKDEFDTVRDTDRIAEVSFERLDNMVDQELDGSIDLIKIDVEGFEEDVLDGATRIQMANPEAVWIIEFSVYGQTAREKVMGSTHSGLALISRLLNTFDYVFLITREGSLLKVDSLAQLRSVMLFGYPVDDLLCCKNPSAELRQLIITQAEFLRRRTDLQITPFVDDHYGGFALNSDLDFWSTERIGHDEDISCAYYIAGSAESFFLKIAPIHSQHSNSDPYPISIYHNNYGQTVNIKDNAPSLEIPIHDHGTWLFITTENSLRASDYLGNPADARKIGFQASLHQSA